MEHLKKITPNSPKKWISHRKKCQFNTIYEYPIDVYEKPTSFETNAWETIIPTWLLLWNITQHEHTKTYKRLHYTLRMHRWQNVPIIEVTHCSCASTRKQGRDLNQYKYWFHHIYLVDHRMKNKGHLQVEWRIRQLAGQRRLCKPLTYAIRWHLAIEEWFHIVDHIVGLELLQSKSSSLDPTMNVIILLRRNQNDEIETWYKNKEYRIETNHRFWFGWWSRSWFEIGMRSSMVLSWPRRPTIGKKALHEKANKFDFHQKRMCIIQMSLQQRFNWTTI